MNARSQILGTKDKFLKRMVVVMKMTDEGMKKDE